MKNFRRKALPAVAALAVASMTLGSVTYAWFTANKTVGISNIDVNVVETQGGIAICKTANGDYSNSVVFTHDKSATDHTQVGDFANYEIKPVSTNGIIDANGKLNFYQGTVSAANPNNLSRSDAITTSDVTKKGYIVMDLFFENQNTADQEVYFNYDLEQDLLTQLFGAGYPISTESLRIAFVNRGYQNTKPTTAAGEDWDGGQTSVAAMIIEPNSGAHLTQHGSAITGVKQDYYGLAGAFTDEQPIKPTADVEDKLEAVDTDEVREHTQKQGIVYYTEADDAAVLKSKGFYQITGYSGDDAAKNGWYKQDSLKHVPAVLYAAADKDAAWTDIDDVWYVTDTLNDGALYAEPTDGQNVRAPHQIDEVKVAEYWVLYETSDSGYNASSCNLKIYNTTTQTGVQVQKEAAHTPLFTLHGEAGGSCYSWIQIYVWLEGQDIDCLSTISDLDFTFAMSFVGEPVA